MRNTSAPGWILLPVLLVLPIMVAAADAQEKVTSTAQGAPESRTLHNTVISADGAWMAAEARSDAGDENVCVWSTEGDVTFTIKRGRNPRISRDSRWVSALQMSPIEQTTSGEPAHKRAGQTLVLLNLQDGSRKTFNNVLSYDLTHFSSHLIYLQSPESNADEPEPAQEQPRGTLHVVELVGDRVFTWQNVTQYAAHQDSDPGVDELWKQGHAYVAIVTHDEKTGRDRLEIAFVGHAKRGWGSGGTYEGETINGLCWARDSITLGFVDSTVTSDRDEKQHGKSALYMWHDVRDQPGRRKFMRVDRDSRALHTVISADGAWMAAEEHPHEGDGNVRVWATEGDVTFTIERGQNPRISRDSRWVSALQKPPLDDSRNASPKKQRAGRTLVLLDTQDGSQRTFDFVLSHDWTYSYDETYTSMHLVYLQSPETKAGEPAAKERTVGTLHMIHMTGEGEDWVFQNVTEFATYERSRYVAYVVHDCQDENHGHEETGQDSLHISGFSAWHTGWQGVYDGEKIEGLRWARDRPMLRFLDRTETTGYDGKRRVNSALYTWQRDDDNPSLDTIFTLMQGDSEFRTLHNPVISADGAWMAAEEHPHEGDGNVRVWATEGDVTFTIERGQNPRISRDSRWVSALQKPLNETTKNKRAGQTLVLLDTQDGSQRTFDFVLSHDWTYSDDETYTSMHLVYLQSPEMKADEEEPSKDDAAKPATKPAAMQRTVGTLQMVHMTGEGHDRMWENVTEFATYERDRYVAYVVHDCQDENHVHEETGRDSLHIEGFSAWQSGMNAIYDGEKIDGLRWARDRLTLGFRDRTETTGEDGKRRVNSALYAWPGRAYDMALPLARRWRQGFPRVDTPQ